jgi:hypothetical protein
MAIGYGLGLAFQGQLKDYSDLVKSREAAKQKAAAAKAAKEQSALDKLYERFTFSNKDRSYLPVHQDAASKTVNDVLDVFAEALQSDTPNLTKVYGKVGQAMIDLNGYVSQKKYFDEINQDPGKRGFTIDEIQAIQTERDPNKLFDIIQKKGAGTSFDKESLTIGLFPVDGFSDNTVGKQLETYFQKQGDSIYNPEDIKVTQNVLGTQYEYSGVAKTAKEGWLASAVNNPSSIRDFEITYKANNPDFVGRLDFSNDEVKKGYLGYLNERYDKYVEPKLSAKSGRAAYVPPATTEGEKAVYDILRYTSYNAREGAETIDSAAGIGFQNVKSSTGIPSNLIDVDTFLPVRESAGTITYSQFLAIPVSPNGKPEVSRSMNLDNIKLKVATKGELIPSKNKVPRSVYSFDKSTQQTAYQNVDSKEKPALAEAIKKLEDAVNKFNSLPAAKRKTIFLELKKGEKSLPELLGGASSRGSM